MKIYYIASGKKQETTGNLYFSVIGLITRRVTVVIF